MYSSGKPQGISNQSVWASKQKVIFNNVLVISLISLFFRWGHQLHLSITVTDRDYKSGYRHELVFTQQFMLAMESPIRHVA
jgi:hypothetical protein